MKEYLTPKFPHLVHGGDYNPEQWSATPEIIDEDMRLLKLSGCNEMTLGVFSWAVLEPEEGVYDFSFMDEAFEKIQAAGGKIILATPSGARPRWVANKYPEVLRVNERREKMLYGHRHNHCYTSPKYRELVGKMNTKLAERYGNHPALIAWHISNEYGGECHCPLCQEAFREYLRKKFDDNIEKLNFQWWTTFWSHKYSSFDEIESPSPLGDTAVHGLNLEWKRFVSYQTCDFIENEKAPLSKITPDIPTVLNLMGFYQGLDYRELAKHVDFVSWDNYPEWHAPWGNERVACGVGLTHDLTRGLKKKNFFMMESTPSTVNWRDINKPKKPGMNALAGIQALAHGSDSIQYFQWRKGRGSSEKFHGAVVDFDGTENTRVFREVAALSADMQKIDEICGTQFPAKVAIIYDWDTSWDLKDAQAFQKQNKKYIEQIISYYKAFWKRGINTDIISRLDDFSSYELIVTPMLYIAEESVIDAIEKFVKSGGTFVSTYTLAQVNENDLVYLGGFPAGKLKDVFGIVAEETDVLHPSQSNSVTADGKEYVLKDMCEIIRTEGARTIAEYSSDWYSGRPAVTVNSYGSGKAYYVAFRDDGSYADLLVEKIAADLKLERALDTALPAGVSAHWRKDGDVKYIFVENYNEMTVEIELGGSYTNLIDGKKYDKIALNGLGYAILK